MTRFQALLTPDPSSTPKAEQDRASLQLPGVVAQSNLRWWKRRGPALPPGKALLLVVAPSSQYDLVLLDLIDEALAPKRGASVPVYVANLQHYDTVEQLHADIPAINQAPPQTPVAAIWEDGALRRSGWGKQARDLAADVLGISADDLLSRILARVPKYTQAS